MRAALHAVLTAAIAAAGAAACGSTTSSSGGVPTVEITSLTADGTAADIEFTASDNGQPVAVSIDWGDGGAATGFRGEGDLAADHDYSTAGVTAVTVTVVVTDDDGNAVRQGRQLTLGPATSSTDPATATTTATTTTTATSTTTTTAAPPSTTVPPPTSTTSPPAPTSTTTTTTPPPEKLTIPLLLSDAFIQANTDRSGNGDDDAEQTGPNRLGVRTKASGISERHHAEVTATWTIPAATFADFGPDPLLGVVFYTQVSAHLEAGNWDGMSSSLTMAATAYYGAPASGGITVGDAEEYVAGVGRNGEKFLSFDEHTLGFGAPATGLDTDLSVVLTARCDVVGSSNLFGALSVSLCDASRDNGGIDITDAHVTVRVNDGG